MTRQSLERIGLTLRLYLEFENLTLGEASNILKQYQAALRSVWRAELSAQGLDRRPGLRLLLKETSTSQSLEVFTDLAIPTLAFTSSIFGPALNWLPLARATIARMAAMIDGVDQELKDGKVNVVDAAELTELARDRVEIIGPQGVQAMIPTVVFYHEQAFERVERLIETIVSSGAKAEIQALEEEDVNESANS